MIKLDREQLTKLLVDNIELFHKFPVVENYCNIRELPIGAEGFVRLVSEIENSQELHDLISKSISTNFEIDKENFDILNGFQLASLIRSNNIEISEGEETWIKNLERIEEALKSSCCSTRHMLMTEANACYADLINQSSSDWIFVKNLKQSLSVSSITFRLPDNSNKKV